MKMVAAAKLKRAQDRILSARPYAHKLRGVVANLGERASRTSHPLLHKRDGNKTELVVVTSDRGLCGGLNINVFKKIESVIWIYYFIIYPLFAMIATIILDL